LAILITFVLHRWLREAVQQVLNGKIAALKYDVATLQVISPLKCNPIDSPLLLLSTIIGPPFLSAGTNLLLTQSLTLRCFTSLQSQLEGKYKEFAKAGKFAELYFQHSCIHLQGYAMLGHHQHVCL
jgi:hypothetical protein